ncbi:NEDD4-binding protein 2 isoform X2 [Scaptodrosophila lebanonensis]|uniref:NEDD4-binding protein 2 isoform X2 n=1 Tax=Drosophila lebanonensis TaxID=7225 RepID=A0A6J2UG57_DROLE|nr:NEDD4-binding protein 2 isoform X2 [Scaptodrosophila lebanonensis]
MEMAGNSAEIETDISHHEGLQICQPEEVQKSNNNMDTSRKYASLPATMPLRMCDSSHHCNSTYNKRISDICAKVASGQRLMIIMRGAPGSGKSTLAAWLLGQTELLENYKLSDFVHSTDDYFYRNGVYQFDRNLLTDAHDWNKKRVHQKASDGWSPIIIDNTNTKIWEMRPYVHIAVQYGYLLEILEPQTGWSKSASKLSQKTVHEVPRENIQRMLDGYESATVPELLELIKSTNYIPQIRLRPPPPMVSDSKLPLLSTKKDQEQISTAESSKLNANAQSYVPACKDQPEVKPEKAPSREKSLLDLLRDDADKPSEIQAPPTEDVNAPQILQRHGLNCCNEHKQFVLLRQMYPNKQLTGLWDLFVKCNGEVSWAVDILLKEDELNKTTEYGQEAFEDDTEPFKCNCSKSANAHHKPLQAKLDKSVSDTTSKPLPQRQQRSRRSNLDANKELQLQIENCFVLGDEQYSEHTRKIRDVRNGILDNSLPFVLENEGVVAAETEMEEEAEAEYEEDNSLLEIDLGEELVAQLRNTFKWEGTLGEVLPPQEQVVNKVFMPRTLAKQLYILWVESIYNQLEEQRHQTLRDDEQFARLLKHPQYADCSESPSNVTELLDMELAWSIYKSEQQAAQQAACSQPNDIATHLTKMKLCEKFPDVPSDTLLEVFAATGNNYSQTVEVLDSNVHSKLSHTELFEQAILEREKLTEQVAEHQKQQLSGSSSGHTPGGQTMTSSGGNNKSPQLHEEAKCAALRDFEETRNLAAHHAQLKAECYLKAKQAVQQGNSGVAIYYSEIAQLHKQKIDVFNHRAANCIMEVHKHTQNNPDLLDLHYLHALEAVSCLDLFLDRHITQLRNSTRVYKHVFIITGRGLHSANGVSTIKNKVKARLVERRLRFVIMQNCEAGPLKT